jgi:hypothetical protein
VPRVISLAAYAVKVRNPSDREYECLSDFDGDGSDLLDFLSKVLSGIKTKTLEDQKELQQAFSVPKLETDGRKLRGEIQTGQYGHENDIVNVKTTQVVYRRKKEDAEMWPFYFYFELPEGVEDGILILQRTAALGIRKLLHWVLDTALQNKYPEYKLRFDPIIVASEFEKFKKGKIQKMSFVKKSIPPDIADSYDKGHQEVHGTAEIVIRARRGSILPLNGLLSRAFDGRQANGILVLNERYENVKAQVKVGHATRTINVANPGRIRSYFDITDTVKMGVNGHPVYESIEAEADKLATELRTLLYGVA